ncbi:MAG: hypothetical protein ABSB76_39890 [Streptosporangiaceae bacterium]|jgi:hypothetical protein
MAGQGPFPWGAGWAKPDGTAASGAEQPTQAAELKVTVGPASAGGRVPQRDAKHFITVGGIAWCITASIVGVVLTLQLANGIRVPGVGSGPIVLALAELVLGLLGSALIAACGHRAALRNDDAGQEAPYPSVAKTGSDARRGQAPSRTEKAGRADGRRMPAPVHGKGGRGQAGT